MRSSMGPQLHDAPAEKRDLCSPAPRARVRLPTVHVAYVGPSQVPGYEHVDVAVVLASLKKPSQNRKTGPMLQVLYVPVAPPRPKPCFVGDVIKKGLLPAVCGDCELQPTVSPVGKLKKGACYVEVCPSVQSPWAAAMRHLHQGVKPDLELAVQYIRTANRPVRFGVVGNPSSVDYEVNAALCEATRDADGVPRATAYDHAWATCDQRYREMCHASVRTPEERRRATAMGWRSARVVEGTSDLLSDERLCAYQASADRVVHCPDCGGEGCPECRALPCPKCKGRGCRRCAHAGTTANPRPGWLPARVQCLDCLRCSGLSRGDGAVNVAILLHGCEANRRAFGQLMSRGSNKEDKR